MYRTNGAHPTMSNAIKGILYDLDDAYRKLLHSAHYAESQGVLLTDAEMELWGKAIWCTQQLKESLNGTVVSQTHLAASRSPSAHPVGKAGVRGR